MAINHLCAICKKKTISSWCYVGGEPSCEQCFQEAFQEVLSDYEPCDCAQCEAERSGIEEPDEDNNSLDGHYCPACGEHLEEGHVCAEIDVLAQDAWNSYKSGMCPCGNAECGGIEWLSDGNDPFERLADL